MQILSSVQATMRIVLVVAIMTVFSTDMLCVHALTLQPTLNSLILNVSNEEVCMYASGKDFYEGMMMHYKLLSGDKDFDVFVRDAHNKTLYASYAGEHNGEERIYFTTHFRGEHAFCVDNRRYSQRPKRVKVELGLSSLQRWKTPIDPLRKLMSTTDGYFMGMHEDQMMLRLREPSLRRKVDHMFTLMTVRGLVETLIIALFCVINLYCITRLLKYAHYGQPNVISRSTRSNSTQSKTLNNDNRSTSALANTMIETEVLTGTVLARARNAQTRHEVFTSTTSYR